MLVLLGGPSWPSHLCLSSWILSKFCYSGLAMRLRGELADIPSKQEQLETRGTFGGGKMDPIRHPTPRGLWWRSLLTYSGTWWKRRVPVKTGLLWDRPGTGVGVQGRLVVFKSPLYASLTV